MMREERVRRAIHFRNPDRVPVLNLNRDQKEGDILMCGLGRSVNGTNEWGYRFETRNDGTMGHPGAPVLASWDDLSGFRSPEICAEERLAAIAAMREQAKDHYLLAGLGITGFNVFTFLRGFENSIVDLLLCPEKAAALLDMIFDFECRLIEIAAQGGCHGVHLADDWGSQETLLIQPELWRGIFKKRYAKQAALAHDSGLDLWFHSCGNVAAIIEDFHDIGVDVMNISQPNAVDLGAAAHALKGRQCFMIPVSYQTVSISGSPEAIIQEARRAYNLLGTPEGGFIGYVEEYSCMGMSEENYQACRQAFQRLG